MPLIARKVYRAFPELDRFSDEQCNRFVGAVNRRPIRRALRMLCVGVCVLFAAAVAFYVFTRLFYRDDGLLKRWAKPWWLIDTLQLMLPLLVAGFCGLVTRDLVIRLQIRVIIRIRGTCLRCGYSLLGIRVVQNRVTCPECGTPAEADEALGELVSGEGGGVIFNPVMHAEVIARRERKRLGWRKIRRRVVVGATVLVFAGAGSYTVWWYRVQRQAERAGAARDLGKQLAAWQSRNRPAVVAADAANSWDRLAVVIARFNNTESKVAPVTWGNNYTALMHDIDELTGWNARWYGQTSAEAREAALKGLAAHLADRTVEDLAALAAKRPLLLQRSIPAPLAGGPLATAWGAELMGVRNCGFMCMVQAHIAMRDGDDQLAIAALSAAILNLEAIEHDPSMFVVGVARELRMGIVVVATVGARQIRDAKVLREMGDQVELLMKTLPRTEHLEAARLQSLDIIRWFYSEPQLVRRSFLMGPQRAVMGTWTQGHSYRPTWLRSREAAEDEVNSMYREAGRGEQLSATAPTLPGIGTSQSVVLLFVRDPWWYVQGEGEAAMLRRVRVAKLTLAAEAYQRERGYYPASLQKLVPAEVAAETLIDPLTNKPFNYSPWDPAQSGPPTVTVG